jgi:hypothetical protein
MPMPIAKILLPLPSTTSARSLLRNLQPGQIFHAKALSNNINGAMQLQIGVARLTAQTTLSVTPGQALILQVEKTGDLPELRVLTLPTQKEKMSAALKTTLPRQQPLPNLFEALTRYVAQPDTPALPVALKQAVQQLLERTISINDANFKSTLPQALQLSGTQTESQLLRKNLVNHDLKLNLMRLIGFVRQHYNLLSPAQPLPLSTSAASGNTQTPTIVSAQPPSPPPQGATPQSSIETHSMLKLLLDLFKHLDGAIARIQTNQLSSLPADDPMHQIWQFELPIRNDSGFDLFHFRIAPEARRGKNQSETGWQLTLHMNLQPLGPMRVNLHLLGECVSTIFWSEKPQTSHLVTKHLERLRKGLESAGLEVKKLASFQGSINNKDEIPNNYTLLNEQA